MRLSCEEPVATPDAAQQAVGMSQDRQQLTMPHSSLVPLVLALLALAHVSVSSAAVQRSLQDPVGGYASGLSGHGRGSCPVTATTGPPVTAPGAASPAPAAAAAANVTGSDALKHDVFISCSSSGSGSCQQGQGFGQCAAPHGGCGWDTFIVRFTHYGMLAEHKNVLKKVRNSITQKGVAQHT